VVRQGIPQSAIAFLAWHPLVIGSTSKAVFGTESRSTVPGNGCVYLPFFGAVSFLAFIDSRKR
jgi:hypothetical protein